ncbi:MAG: methyltransferase domain-containing protein [Acidobacteriota bacterium]
MPPFLARRHRLPELMDDPALDPAEHRRALDALGWASVVSLTAPSIWPAIHELAAVVTGRPIRVLDVACGGGHLVVALAGLARRDGLAIDLIGCDVSAVAVDYARALARRSGHERVRFVQADAFSGDELALDGSGEPGSIGFDAVISSLFLHHLDDDAVVAMLARMRRAARLLVVASDLRRTKLGFAYAWVGCRVLGRSRVFRVDGALSVRAAFTMEEVRRLADAAGLDRARVIARWPQRLLLSWRRA